jgi:hypothetical protein
VLQVLTLQVARLRVGNGKANQPDVTPSSTAGAVYRLSEPQ